MNQKGYKVEIRKDCKICGGDLPPRYRTFCSAQCRNKHNNKKFYNPMTANVKAKAKTAEYAPGKIECLLCLQENGESRWYRQIGSHITQIHRMTAREYREKFDLEVKRGLLSPDLKELYGRQVFENGTVENLKQGAKYRFKKGDPRAGKYKRSHITIERLRKLKRGKSL